jgi:lantibiotic modifying enzyme
MKIDADLHNFGQHVTQIERASEVYFQKPRPIYWEWFFFGNNSPLRNFFASDNSRDNNIAEILFNLEVHFEKDDCGFSKEVREADESNDQNAHAYNLGILIAYCYIFGIRDLHKGNVIRRKSHLQVIDAEVVLSKILLPNETLLLPFKTTTAEMCAANKSFDNIPAINLDILKLILTGFFDLFSEVIEKRDRLISIFGDHREKMLTVPIRHIMRDTSQYRKWQECQVVPGIPFCSDELKQLERGDIPYYFKFIADPKLYAYKNQSGEYEAISSVPAEFLKGINRDATGPLELLGVSRLCDELIPTGSLFLLKKLAPEGFTGTIDGTNFMAEVTLKNLQISFGGKVFNTKI